MDASNLASCLAPTLMPIPGDKDPVQYLAPTLMPIPGDKDPVK